MLKNKIFRAHSPIIFFIMTCTIIRLKVETFIALKGRNHSNRCWFIHFKNGLFLQMNLSNTFTMYRCKKASSFQAWLHIGLNCMQAGVNLLLRLQHLINAINYKHLLLNIMTGMMKQHIFNCLHTKSSSSVCIKCLCVVLYWSPSCELNC